jgi:hypothetical protein
LKDADLGRLAVSGPVCWRKSAFLSARRANALEHNVVLYKVEAGVRLSIALKGLPSRSYGVKRDIPSGRWNTFRVVFQDRLFTVFLNGDHLFDVVKR